VVKAGLLAPELSLPHQRVIVVSFGFNDVTMPAL
jgi:hypothetical protein